MVLTSPRYEDFVVQDNFKFGDDKEIVSVSLYSEGLLTNSFPDRCTAE